MRVVLQKQHLISRVNCCLQMRSLMLYYNSLCWVEFLLPQWSPIENWIGKNHHNFRDYHSGQHGAVNDSLFHACWFLLRGMQFRSLVNRCDLSTRWSILDRWYFCTSKRCSHTKGNTVSVCYVDGSRSLPVHSTIIAQFVQVSHNNSDVFQEK